MTFLLLVMNGTTGGETNARQQGTMKEEGLLIVTLFFPNMLNTPFLTFSGGLA